MRDSSGLGDCAVEGHKSTLRGRATATATASTAAAAVLLVVTVIRAASIGGVELVAAAIGYFLIIGMPLALALGVAWLLVSSALPTLRFPSVFSAVVGSWIVSAVMIVVSGSATLLNSLIMVCVATTFATVYSVEAKRRLKSDA